MNYTFRTSSLREHFCSAFYCLHFGCTLDSNEPFSCTQRDTPVEPNNQHLPDAEHWRDTRHVVISWEDCTLACLCMPCLSVCLHRDANMQRRSLKRCSVYLGRSGRLPLPSSVSSCVVLGDGYVASRWELARPPEQECWHLFGADIDFICSFYTLRICNIYLYLIVFN